MCRSRPQITLRSYSLILLLIQYVYELILLILAHHLSGCKSRKLFFIIQIYFRKKNLFFFTGNFRLFLLRNGWQKYNLFLITSKFIFVNFLSVAFALNERYFWFASPPLYFVSVCSE